MSDDDNAPPISDDDRRRHFERFEPGTPVVRVIGPEESVRIARLERSHEDVQRVVTSLQATRATQNKLLVLAIPALLGALGTVVVYAANRIATSSEAAGEARAEMRALKEHATSEAADLRERIRRAELEIDQLRATLLHLSTGEPHKPTSTDDALPPTPDRYSLPYLRDGQGGAAALGDSGRVDLHVPKLQNGHDLIVPELHSMFELHVAPHVLRGAMAEVLAQAARATRAMATTIVTIPLIPEM